MDTLQPGVFRVTVRHQTLLRSALLLSTTVTECFDSLGHRAISTCSPKNFELVKSYGADAIFDYHSPTCAAEIKKLTRNNLRYVVDPFSQVRTMSLCDDSMGRAGGKYVALEMYQEPSSEKAKLIKRELIMGQMITGGAIRLGEPYGKPEDVELGKWGIECYKSIQRLIDSGKLRPHPLRCLDGGLEAVLEGLEMLKKKEVSAEKLVVRLE